MSIVHTLNQTTRVGQRCFTSMLDLFLGRGCGLCDRPAAQTFCIDCHRQLKDSYHPNATWTCDENGDWPISALGNYEGSLKQAIRALKYSRREDIAIVLGNAFGQQWPRLLRQLPTQHSLATPPYVVPIPLHTNRYQQRGYNQAERIAKGFCQTSGLPMLAGGLKRIEDTLPQHQLGVQSRQENLDGAFTVGRELTRRCRQSSPRILLIDDIYTTGATMRSATEVLNAAGISVVGVLAIARAVSN